MNDNLKQVFRKTAETLVAEKRVIEYLTINRWGLEKKIPNKLIDAFLKEVPEYKCDEYRKNGMPYYFHGVEFRLFAKEPCSESV